MLTIIKNYDCVVWLLFGLYLASGTVMDLRTKSVPCWWLAGGGVLTVVLAVSPLLAGIETGFVLKTAGAVFGSVFVLVSIIKPKCFGKADGLLIVMIGCLIGLLRMVDVLALSFLLAAVFGILSCGGRQFRKQTLAFIPFLSAGFLVQGAISLWAK